MPIVIPGGLAAILLLKEAADFLQIGLVAWQTKQRFSRSFTGRGGVVGIDGNSVTLTLDSVRATIPIEDAAAAAGVPGAGPGGKKPKVVLGLPAALAPKGSVLYPLSTAAASDAWTARYGRPRPGEDAARASQGTNPDDRPFTLREYLVAQELGKSQRQNTAINAEQELTAIKQDHAERIALLNAEIARERIAAEVDITRLRIVASLTEQRERLAAQFALQERELESRLQLQRERLAADERQLGIKFEQQLGLARAEQLWKTSERTATQQWTERVKREGEDWANYYTNLNSDLALTRAIDAARKIADVVAQYGKGAGQIVDFAQAFAR